MKQLIVKDSTARSCAPAIEPQVSYMNLYLKGILVGAHYSTLSEARGNRVRRGAGVTIKLSRTNEGDFEIQKIEEF